MRTLKRILFLASFVLIGTFAANAQMCGGWNVFVVVVDKEHRGILNASMKLIDLPEDADATKRPFGQYFPDSNVYFASFMEGQNVGLKSDGLDYAMLISAPGYRDLKTTVHINYCHQTQQTRVLDTK